MQSRANAPGNGVREALHNVQREIQDAEAWLELIASIEWQPCVLAVQ